MTVPTHECVTNDRTLAATIAVHAAATMAMVGLIWTVQVVHYPLFESVGAEAYPNYQSRHIDRIGAVLVVRSEERRVGKECRSRWSPYH